MKFNIFGVNIEIEGTPHTGEGKDTMPVVIVLMILATLCTILLFLYS